LFTLNLEIRFRFGTLVLTAAEDRTTPAERGPAPMADGDDTTEFACALPTNNPRPKWLVQAEHKWVLFGESPAPVCVCPATPAGTVPSPVRRNAVRSDRHVSGRSIRTNPKCETGVESGRQLYKFFEAQYRRLDESNDEIAERAKSLRAKAVRTLTALLILARLQEQPKPFCEVGQMLEELIAGHESIIRNQRSNVDTCAEKNHDVETADFVSRLMTEDDKTAWMVRAFFQ